MDDFHNPNAIAVLPVRVWKRQSEPIQRRMTGTVGLLAKQAPNTT